ncbi:MAG: ferredoxin [Desulfarculaceae bacterium]|nr:ferredoxin [Desulfarculaceae bacterium]
MKDTDVCRTVEIEMEDCILCGVCTELAPQIFRFNDAGYIEVDDSGGIDPAAFDQAVANCPKDCIILQDKPVD